MTPEQEAVIAAAQDALYDMRERGYDHRWELSNEKYQKLDKTIRNLQALHAPEPVRPEDVKPGTWFRFADGAKDHKSCLLLQSTQPMWWSGDIYEGPLGFTPHDRIIPIDEDSQS